VGRWGRYGRDRYGRGSGYGGFAPYVPVAVRRANAAKEMAKLAKKGVHVSPVVIEGRAIASTFWGKAWCDNLERYSDFENRLPRGRAYVRNGSVVDLQIGKGVVGATVSGSALYTVKVSVKPVPAARWKALCEDCGGAIDSVIELLRGRFSKAVMERICRQGTGLFPSPSEIEMHCSCPDWATMCKHVAAVLYGIGARLDESPDLLFRLRDVDPADLIANAGKGLTGATAAPASGKVLGEGDLSAIFGVEMAEAARPSPAKRARPSKPVPVPLPEPEPEPRPAARARPPRQPPRIDRKPAAAAPAAATPVALPKRTPVRMLAGIHAGRTGFVSWANADGSVHTVSFDDGQGKAATQVRSSSFGVKWELARSAGPASPLAKGTEVRMTAGIYLGYSGRVASVTNARSGRDALYTLALTGPDGRKARTTVKHGSLGRVWTVA